VTGVGGLGMPGRFFVFLLAEFSFLLFFFFRGRVCPWVRVSESDCVLEIERVSECTYESDSEARESTDLLPCVRYIFLLDLYEGCYSLPFSTYTHYK